MAEPKVPEGEALLEATIQAGPLTITTKATVDQVAALLRQTAKELIDAKIVDAPPRSAVLPKLRGSEGELEETRDRERR